jgi:hypothetical protein
LPVALPSNRGDVVLDLNECFEAAYAGGGFDRTTDYSRDVDPPLRSDDMIWAHELLKSKGLRR